jgi:hypothetical protein
VLNDRTRLVGEAIRSEDETSGDKRQGGLVGIERSFDHGLKAEVGVRRVEDDPAAGSTEPATDDTVARAKLTTQVPYVPRASAYTEVEQDVDDSDKHVLALGGDYRLENRTRFYAREEVISSLTGPYELDATAKTNSTVFGIESQYFKEDHVFSEYRVADAIDGREAQGAIGLRNRWQLVPGLRLNTSLERVQAFSGDTLNLDNSAAALGVEYTRSNNWKATARIEYHDGNEVHGYLWTVGAARKLSADWTFLAKSIVSMTTQADDAPNREEQHFQAGFAYRDSETNRFNALVRYEYKREQNGLDTGIQAGSQTSMLRYANIVSIHADYELAAHFVLTGVYAIKLVKEFGDGIPTNSNAQMLGARLTRDIAKRWDIGFAVHSLFTDGISSRQTSLGTEAGYLVKDNLWVSLGLNVIGFHDVDLSGEEYTRQGVYLRLRFKFDETLLQKTD